MEVKCFELRDRLEEEGEVDEDEIEEQVDALRKKLVEEMERGGGAGDAGRRRAGLKSHQVHELAEAKEKEMKRMEAALGISSTYEEVGKLMHQDLKYMADCFYREATGRNRRSESSTESLVIHRMKLEYYEIISDGSVFSSFSPLILNSVIL